MIVKTFDLYDFMEEFEKYDRGDNFSDEALERLFDYYDGFGEPYELDVIEICCSWTEFESLSEYAGQYMDESDFEGIEDDGEKEEIILKNLDRNTCFYRLNNGGVLMQDY